MGITGSAVFGTNLAEILNYWADIGVFSSVLPFLLIFAVTYGILSKIQIFGKADERKGIYAVIGIAVGLLSLQFDVVPGFFATIFPYAGVGIGILLVGIIIIGLFGGNINDPNSMVNKILLWSGVAIAVIVIIVSLTDLDKWAGGLWWDQYGPALITLAVIGTLVAITLGGKGGTNVDTTPANPPATPGNH